MPAENSTYRINANNKAYIEAIKTFNKKMKIINVNGKQLTNSVDIQDLNTIIQDSQLNNEIIIKCSAVSPASTANIFPPLPDEGLVGSRNGIQAHTVDAIAEVTLQVKKYIVNSALSSVIQSIPLPNFSFIALFNQYQAFEVLYQLKTNEIDILGAIHLKEISTIIIQTQAEDRDTVHNFSFNYLQLTIEKIDYLSFDLDDGFLDRRNISATNEIITSLNKIFLIWKNRHRYHKPLFSDENTGFIENNALIAQDEKTVFVNEFRPTKINIDDFLNPPEFKHFDYAPQKEANLHIRLLAGICHIDRLELIRNKLYVYINLNDVNEYVDANIVFEKEDIKFVLNVLTGKQNTSLTPKNTPQFHMLTIESENSRLYDNVYTGNKLTWQYFLLLIGSTRNNAVLDYDIARQINSLLYSSHSAILSYDKSTFSTSNCNQLSDNNKNINLKDALENILSNVKVVVTDQKDNYYKIKFQTKLGLDRADIKNILLELSKHRFNYTLNFSNCRINNQMLADLIDGIINNKINVIELNLNDNFFTKAAENLIYKLIDETNILVLSLKAKNNSFAITKKIFDRIQRNPYLFGLDANTSSLTNEENEKLVLKLSRNEFEYYYQDAHTKNLVLENRIKVLEHENATLKQNLQDSKNAVQALHTTHGELYQEIEGLKNLNQYVDPKIIEMQALTRGLITKKDHQTSLANVTKIQSVIRMFSAIKEKKSLAKEKENLANITKIQSVIRMFPIRKEYMHIQDINHQITNEISAAASRRDFKTVGLLSQHAENQDWEKALALIAEVNNNKNTLTKNK